MAAAVDMWNVTVISKDPKQSRLFVLGAITTVKEIKRLWEQTLERPTPSIIRRCDRSLLNDHQLLTQVGEVSPGCKAVVVLVEEATKETVPIFRSRIDLTRSIATSLNDASRYRPYSPGEWMVRRKWPELIRRPITVAGAARLTERWTPVATSQYDRLSSLRRLSRPAYADRRLSSIAPRAFSIFNDRGIGAEAASESIQGKRFDGRRSLTHLLLSDGPSVKEVREAVAAHLGAPPETVELWRTMGFHRRNCLKVFSVCDDLRRPSMDRYGYADSAGIFSSSVEVVVKDVRLVMDTDDFPLVRSFRNHIAAFRRLPDQKQLLQGR